MSSAPAWLGLDLGTSGVRALAVSADGRVLGRGDRRVESRRDGPRHEQSPEDWWDAVGGATHDALDELSADRVRGLAVCGTSGTILLVDPRNGAPLTPGLMYDDARAAAQADRFGAPTSWALSKLLWLVDHDPELAAAGRLAHQPDFITRRLAGAPVPTDSSHALKTGYDLAAEEWPRRVTDALPGGLLPEVVRPGTILGSVCPAAAAHTGLAPGTPIVAGMTDGCAAQIAAGALGVGDWSSVLGTTLVIKGVTEASLDDPAHGLYSHRAPDGEWLPGGASSAGAGALEAAFPGRDLDALTRAAAPHAETRVIAYPLAGRGERFPFRAPDAEGFVVGEPAGDAELFAALLQGLAFVERLCFDVLDHRGAPIDGELTLTGRAAANRRLSQLRADVLGRPVRLVDHGESAFGMAILAASPRRRLADVAASMVRARDRFEPRPAETDRLAARYAEFVGELVRRGWLDPEVAGRALGRPRC
ncbi:MAG: D-ribulokinase [Solirubrobacteraceae bacterium]|nr:D-ribulokinase [Solirubrobacteraceae bacterium]